MKLRLPAPTIRLRLTLVYGGLFLCSASALLAITYVLVNHQYTGDFFISSGRQGVVASKNITPLITIRLAGSSMRSQVRSTGERGTPFSPLRKGSGSVATAWSWVDILVGKSSPAAAAARLP